MPDISNKVFCILTIIVILFTSTLGCLFYNDNDDDKPKSFESDDLADTTPLAYGQGSPNIEPPPVVNTSIPKQTVSVIAIWLFEKNVVYINYGGIVKISIKNNGTNNIYIYRIGIKPEWYKQRMGQKTGEFIDTGKYIKPGEEEAIGMISFYGPTRVDDYKYNILFSLYNQNETGSWNDCGSQEASAKSFRAESLPGTVNYKEHYNIPQYYDKVNGLVEPSDPGIYNLTHKIANNYPGAFNIYQAAAMFDYVHENVKYFSDPSTTTNYWCTPEQTLKFGGDCEDHSILLASMLISLGGSVRMFMTDSHAFLGLYVGDDSNIVSITSAIQAYYGTQVTIFSLQDDLGNWLMVDSIGSIYLGGLPLGAVPQQEYSETSTSGYNWSWGFTNTESFFITDVIPK